MFFSAPLYLLGLLALPIPFIIHLFERRRVKRIDFPWLRLVEESIKGGNLFLRLKEWILLAMRTLALLLLIMAFANPTLSRERGIIVIDDSYDMYTKSGEGILFDEAKDIAERTASDKGYNIVLSSGRGYDKNIEPSFKMYHPPQDEEGDVIFITAKMIPQKEGIIILEGEKNLLSIDTVYLKDPLPQTGTSNTINVGVSNPGENEVRRNVLLQWQGDRSYIEFSFPPGQTYFSLPIEFNGPGSYSGYVDIGEDALFIDNIYYLSFEVPKKITVGVVEGDEGSSFYVERALNPEGVKTEFELSKISHPGLINKDVLIFVDAPYAENGIPSLIFREGASGYISRDFYFSLGDIDRVHPIFSIFDEECIEEIASHKIFKRAEAGLEGKVLAYFSDGQQAILQRDSNMFFQFLPTVESTDLVLSPNFPPILYRTIRYLKKGFDYPAMTYCGKDVRMNVDENRVYDVIDLTEEARWKVAPLNETEGLFLSFRPPHPGIYSIGSVGKIAANIERGFFRAKWSDMDRRFSSLKRWFLLFCLVFLICEMLVRNLRS